MSRGSPRTQLGRDDWAAAALAALAEGGVAAVAVEPIAARLGTTKGSFYWHFTRRDDLLTAALERWERQHTVEVNAEVAAAHGSPRERLRLLVRRAVALAESDPVAVTLLASAGHPAVGPVLARVTDLRLTFLARLFREAGATPAVARRRALLTYSAYLGHLQLAHSTPGVLPRGTAARHAYLDLVLDSLSVP